jgi:hypothetical protein
MLRRSWYKFKMLKKEGDRGWDAILQINRIQRALGLELTSFNDGPDLDWVKHQLDLEEGTGVEQTSTDLELKYEEDQSASPADEDIFKDDRLTGIDICQCKV